MHLQDIQQHKVLDFLQNNYDTPEISHIAMVAFRRNSVVSIQPTKTPTVFLKLPTTRMDIIIAVSDEEIEQS